MKNMRPRMLAVTKWSNWMEIKPKNELWLSSFHLISFHVFPGPPSIMNFKDAGEIINVQHLGDGRFNFKGTCYCWVCNRRSRAEVNNVVVTHEQCCWTHHYLLFFNFPKSFLLRGAYSDMILDGLQPSRDSFHRKERARLQDAFILTIKRKQWA